MSNISRRCLIAGAVLASFLVQCGCLAQAQSSAGIALEVWPNPAAPNEPVTAFATFPEQNTLTTQVQWFVDGTPVGYAQELKGTKVQTTLPPFAHGAHELSISCSVPGADTPAVVRMAQPLIIDTPPVLPRFGFGVTGNQSCLVPLVSLLQGIRDPDGDGVQIVQIAPVSSTGAVVARMGDSIVYHPAAGSYGSDAISYQVQDDLGARVTGIINVQLHSSGNTPRIMLAKGQVNVQFAQAPQKNFVVESTTDLQNWTALTSFSGQQTSYQLAGVQDADAASPSRFYRVRFE
jgi:hypothetical protein